MKNLSKLFASLGMVFLAGAVGSLVTFQSIPNWYAGLKKPFFSPPNFVFGPVWTILYIMMAWSFFLVWSGGGKTNKSSAVNIFLIQLVVNSLWSIAFFGLHSPVLGLIVIIGLLYSIILTIRKFALVNKLASRLLYPYLVWVSFATLLNFSVMILNW